MTQTAVYQNANTFVAKWDRRLLSLFAAAGTAPSVQWTDPLKVQAKGTPTMHLDVLGGDCIIPCVAGTGNFTIDYGAIIYNNDATVDLTISPAHATYGRIDLVIVQLYDDGTAGGSKGVLEVVTGVASGSPAVPATPANAYKLAEIAVAAAVTSITNANITDRRATTAPVRSGGFITADLANSIITPVKLNLSPSTVEAADNINTSSASYVDMANMSITKIMSGKSALILFTAPIISAPAAQLGYFQILEDSTVLAVGYIADTSTISYADFNAHVVRTPSAGSHTYKVQWKVTGGGAVTQGGAIGTRRLSVIEIG